MLKEEGNNMPLKLYKKRYEDIIHSDLIDRKKNLKLIQLMMDMESAFSIPMIKNEAWNERNKDVIQFFQQVSNSRRL